MTVLLKNATVLLCDAARNPIVTDPVIDNPVRGNFQRDKRSSQEISALLLGRGRNENDRPYLYRVRIDPLPNGYIPVINDTVFIGWHKTMPMARGWYTVWDEADPTTGELPSLVLYLHKEFN